MEFTNICVVGLGYIGLPTASALAGRRKNVIGVDVNKHIVETINAGNIHIKEPELDIAVNAAVSQGYLRADTKPQSADVFLIAVPTPFKELHQPDLTYIEAACASIAPVLQKDNLVILESTSPVGTTEQVARWLAEARLDLTFPQDQGEHSDIRIAYCPERVLPGQVLRELVQNDRVIGGLTKKCAEIAAEFYQIFVQGECILTDVRTAEMCKLTENAFRDVNIAFANELSMICERMRVDVWKLIPLANRHPRVNILQPGPGVGGHCIAVDPWFIISQNPDQSRLIHAARLVNDQKPNWVFSKVESAIDEILAKHPEKKRENITIGCFGLAFKADIDDLRESPALEITRQLANCHPGKLLVVEPNIRELPSVLKKPNVKFSSTEDAITDADLLVILVDHKLFKFLDIKKFAGKFIVDTRGIWIRQETLQEVRW